MGSARNPTGRDVNTGGEKQSELGAYGVEEDGLRGLAVNLLLVRLRSNSALDNLPEGIPIRL